MSSSKEQSPVGEGAAKAAIIYRVVVACLAVSLLGLAPFWEEHSDHFGFGFFPYVAAMAAFYPLLLLVLINLSLSINQLIRARDRYYLRALLLDGVAMLALLFGALSTEVVW